jgi:hypothetical protein
LYGEIIPALERFFFPELAFFSKCFYTKITTIRLRKHGLRKTLAAGRFMMKRLALLVCALYLGSAGLWAQKAIVDQTPVVEEFTGFLGNGFAPNPIAGQLDSDEFAILGFSQGILNFGGTQITGSFARGTSDGGVTLEGVYAGISLDFLFIQPGDNDFTPGYLTIRYVNNHVDPITTLDVSYSIEELNNGPRSSSWNLSYSTNDVMYTAVPALNFSSMEAADAPPILTWLERSRSTTLDLSLTPVASGGFFYLRFSSDDVSGTGDRDEIGINHLIVTATNLPVELERVSVE